MVMVTDSLPKLKSFLGIELELGIKIFSLVLTVVILVEAIFSGTYIWIGAGPVLATLSAIAFGLAFFALQWKKTRELLIPAAVMAPILSLVCLIFFIMVLVKKTSAEAVIIALFYLLEAILSAYYWVGLMTLYGSKSPTRNPIAIVA